MTTEEMVRALAELPCLGIGNGAPGTTPHITDEQAAINERALNEMAGYIGVRQSTLDEQFTSEHPTCEACGGSGYDLRFDALRGEHKLGYWLEHGHWCDRCGASKQRPGDSSYCLRTDAGSLLRAVAAAQWGIKELSQNDDGLWDVILFGHGPNDGRKDINAFSYDSLEAALAAALYEAVIGA